MLRIMISHNQSKLLSWLIVAFVLQIPFNIKVIAQVDLSSVNKAIKTAPAMAVNGEEEKPLNIIANVLSDVSEYKVAPSLSAEAQIVNNSRSILGTHLMMGLKFADTAGLVSASSNLKRLLIRELSIIHTGFDYLHNFGSEEYRIGVTIGLWANVSGALFTDFKDTSKKRQSQAVTGIYPHYSLQFAIKDKFSFSLGQGYCWLADQYDVFQKVKGVSTTRIEAKYYVDLSSTKDSKLNIHFELISLGGEKETIGYTGNYLFAIRIGASQAFAL